PKIRVGGVTLWLSLVAALRGMPLPQETKLVKPRPVPLARTSSESSQRFAAARNLHDAHSKTVSESLEDDPRNIVIKRGSNRVRLCLIRGNWCFERYGKNLGIVEALRNQPEISNKQISGDDS